MRFDLVKMPLVPAFLTLAALAAFGLGCLPTGAPVADPRGAIAPGSLPLLPLGAALDRFQALFPLGAKLLGGLLLLFTGSSLGRLSMRYNLYVTTTCLALPLYGAALREDTADVREVDLRRCAMAVGSEGRGLSAAVLAACDKTVRIPMDPRCESLNAASAASVLLWEAARGEY